MRVNACWFGYELDFNLELPSVSFSFGPFVDEDPEPVEVERPQFGDVVSNQVGFTRSAQPEWEAPGSYHQFDPDETSEDY